MRFVHLWYVVSNWNVCFAYHSLYISIYRAAQKITSTFPFIDRNCRGRIFIPAMHLRTELNLSTIYYIYKYIDHILVCTKELQIFSRILMTIADIGISINLCIFRITYIFCHISKLWSFVTVFWMCRKLFHYLHHDFSFFFFMHPVFNASLHPKKRVSALSIYRGAMKKEV